MGSGLKAQNMTEIRAQRKGLRAQKNGIGDHKAFEPKSGIRVLHGLKISSHNFFLHNKVCVHRISCQGSCFRLTAVPVIRSPGCLTKTWYHILNLLIVEGTVIWISSHFSRFVTQLLNALSTPEGRESDLYISFLREVEKKKKDKKKSCDRERYVSTSLTDLLLARVQT